VTIASLKAASVPPSRASLPMVALTVWFRVRRLAFSRANGGVRRMWAARVGFYRAMWRRACEATGVKLSIGRDGEMEMSRGGKVLRARDNETYVDDPSAIRRAGDKLLVHRLLDQAEIPTPRYMVVSIDEFDRALSFLRSSDAPVVVKPMAFTGGGCGVTTNVMTEKQLRAAMAWARTFRREILIEQQIEGDCYRILFLDGEHLDSIRRRPPSVIGDGRSTIRQLLRRENLRRVNEGARRSQAMLVTDRDLVNTLARQGLTLSSRPGAGVIVRLKQIVNENAIQENEPAGAVLCPEIITAARAAAELVGLRLAGVDLICRDPSLPLSASGGAILEVNARPNLYYHHLEGREASIAVKILTVCLELRREICGVPG
jgi:glutathione synthase/RimK-type ligase-like ATP-grasp enzyme